MTVKETDLLSETECADLARIMNIKYAASLKDRSFSIANQLEPSVTLLTVTLENPTQSFHYPVEARMAYDQQKLSVRASIQLMLDYVDLYFEEFLQQDERLFIPIDWGSFEFEGYELHLRGQVQNLQLEKAADEWL